MKPTDITEMLLLGMKEPLASRIRTTAEANGKKLAEWAQAALEAALDVRSPPIATRRPPRSRRR